MQDANGRPDISMMSEIYDNGFTVIPSRPETQLLDEITNLSSQLFRNPRNPYDGTPIDSAKYGLVREPSMQLDNQADIIMQVQGGFSFLRVTGKFIRDYTTLCGKQKSASQNGKSEHPLQAGETHYLASRAYDSDTGIASMWLPPGHDEAAFQLQDQLPLIYDCIDRAVLLAAQLGIADLFSRTHADNVLLEFPLYHPGAVVDGGSLSNPVHQHDADNEFFWAVQTTPDNVDYISGRSPTELVQTIHRQGEVVAVDARAPHGPKPSETMRASVIFSAFDTSRGVLYRACEKMQRTTDWIPTALSERSPFNPGAGNELAR